VGRLAAVHDDARRVLSTLVRIPKPDAASATMGGWCCTMAFSIALVSCGVFIWRIAAS
jgi:hypothetical protein